MPLLSSALSDLTILHNDSKGVPELGSFIQSIQQGMMGSASCCWGYRSVDATPVQENGLQYVLSAYLCLRREFDAVDRLIAEVGHVEIGG